MTERCAVESAETLAALRALVANENRLAVRCEDHLAKYFVGTTKRVAASVVLRALPRAAVKGLLDLAVPGAYCFAIARTRHFDQMLLDASASSFEQVVLLGAGYDSRPYRFREALAGMKIFELDHPGTQSRKRRILDQLPAVAPNNLTYISIDFTKSSLPSVLSKNGFSRDRKTLFLWEGVSYYLPPSVVQEVLEFVGSCAPASTIIFDYAIKSFVDGDTTTFGGKQVAAWLRKIDEPFLFGLDPQEIRQFFASQKLDLVCDLGPELLEKRYLGTRCGATLGPSLGHVRIAHAQAVDPA